MHAAGGSDAQRAAPLRPSIAPVLMVGLAMWAACGLSYSQARCASQKACMVIAVGFAATSVVLLVAAFLRGRPLALLALCGACVGVVLGAGYGAALHAQADDLMDVGQAEAVLVLLEDSRDNGYSERAAARIEEGPGRGSIVLADFGQGRELRFGHVVRCKVEFHEFTSKNSEFGWQKAACCNARATASEDPEYRGVHGALLDVRARAIDALATQRPSSGLLQALVCGYRRNVAGTDEYADFQACGLAHFVAVSGAHLVIVTSLFASALRALRAPRRFSIAALAFVMVSYLVVSGMPVSALRAVAMSGLGLMSFFGRRRASSQGALGAGIMAIVCANPAASISASFCLSALSTLGIVLFSALFAHLIGLTPFGRLRIVCESLGLTMAASLLSQLYATSLFYQLPIVSPLANVLLGPLFAPTCAMGLVAALAQLAGLPFAQALVVAAELLAHAMQACVHALAGLPYACVPFAMDTGAALVVSSVCAAVLWAWWPRRAGQLAKLFGGACAIGACALLAVAMSASDRIVMLDVGQGDAFLIESRGQRLLIDTGNQDRMLLEELARMRIAHIDTVLVTHADDDHFGSLDVIARTVDVERVVVANDMLECVDESCAEVLGMARNAAREVVPVEYGSSFEVGAFEASVVWPRSYSDNGGNADSLCLAVSYDGDDDGSSDFTALFTGDAEVDELAAMIDGGDVGHVDLLKVGHHGSRNGMTPDQVGVLSPRVALIGVGEGNRYGHPAPEIVQELEAAGCAVFRSDRDGEVRCTLTPERLSVEVLG